MKIKVKKLTESATIPKYQTAGAAGFDLHADESLVINSGQTMLVKTGLAFEIPQGYELQVRPRSGLSLKTSLRVSNSPGTVDSDYRGEVCVIMTNTSTSCSGGAVAIEKGDRVAQGVICPIIRAEFESTDTLGDTDRGQGAFGSTGK